MCNRLTKLSVTMWYTFFGIFDDTSLWILPKTHDPSLCDTPDELYCSPRNSWFTYISLKYIKTYHAWNIHFLNLCILFVYLCGYEAITFLNCFTLSELKFTQILEGSLFHDIAALLWNVFLPKFVFHSGITKLLWNWLQVHFEWTEWVKVKTKDK